jgi:2-polyprenyl-3-methyl-5-hydroxy-6-metoxy-1,4-benzoquinol methylase
MTTKGVWEEFFDGHAPEYMENCFIKDTLREVEFLLAVLNLPSGSSILDIGCGTGRHSVELARRGYRVTGVDISSGMLAEAQKAAQEAGVAPVWTHCDAAHFKAAEQFDAAICLCEGAFALIGTNEEPDEHDRAILLNIRTALRPGSPFVLTTLNGLRKIRNCTQEQVESGIFDPMTLTETLDITIDTPEGKKSFTLRERGYLPQMITRLLAETGFEVEHIWGGTAGNWGRRHIELDEMEIMVVARRAG